jgi:purine nucleosidase
MEEKEDIQYAPVKNRKVFFDHDGNPEDIVSLMLVLGMPNIDLIGISVTPADCHIKEALELTLKILSIYDRKIPVAEGHITSKFPFPDKYRAATISGNILPMMIN